MACSGLRKYIFPDLMYFLRNENLLVKPQTRYKLYALCVPSMGIFNLPQGK